VLLEWNKGDMSEGCEIRRLNANFSILTARKCYAKIRKAALNTRLYKVVTFGVWHHRKPSHGPDQER
jgi:hypothetical protein